MKLVGVSASSLQSCFDCKHELSSSKPPTRISLILHQLTLREVAFSVATISRASCSHNFQCGFPMCMAFCYSPSATHGGATATGYSCRNRRPSSIATLRLCQRTVQAYDATSSQGRSFHGDRRLSTARAPPTTIHQAPTPSVRCEVARRARCVAWDLVSTGHSFPIIPLIDQHKDQHASLSDHSSR